MRGGRESYRLWRSPYRSVSDCFLAFREEVVLEENVAQYTSKHKETVAHNSVFE